MPVLLIPIAIPLLAAGALLLLPRRFLFAKEAISLFAAVLNLAAAWILFGKDAVYVAPWVGLGVEFSLRLYHFSGMIMLAAACFGFLVLVYSVVFMKGREHAGPFFAYLLISLSLTNGAVLANNLVVLLFFWEGLLLTTFAMISVGRAVRAYRTATKAFIIVGVSDLCMMVGIGLAGFLARTMTISAIRLPADALGGLAFVLLMIGAIAKAGSMPFHTWIPDAAEDAPLPFMAIFPASLEKLLGIYFLVRISVDMFALTPASWASPLLMVIGCITIVAAVMMALIQKDYKRLLSYHAVSQVGYMILGIGTCLPAGIVGGLFHMVNNALYKTCLFLTGGSVERQAGTTDLQELGGLAWKMPLTFVCFFVAAVSISGVPPFNGFFSKELVYEAALKRNFLFYLAAVVGSFFTAASFLKLGHAAFFGPVREKLKSVKETAWPMLLPMLAIAGICIFFGVNNRWPLEHLIQPVLGLVSTEGHGFSGMPADHMLVIVTAVVLVGAILNHIAGAAMTGSGLKAADHIYHAPVLSGIYEKAQRRVFDPYEAGMKVADYFAKLNAWLDAKIDAFSERGVVAAIFSAGQRLSRLHTGNYSIYIVWALVGMLLALIFVVG
jgi:NADH-quinone oxidoreductase subunit L